MQTTKSVLFVCTGNTCRSPMAEGMFRAAIEEHPTLVSNGSAGVAAYDGDGMNPDTVAELKRMNASIEGFRSRSVTSKLLEESTHIFAMTRAHLQTLAQIFPEYADKCYLVCDFYEINGKFGEDIPDPIGRGSYAYEQVGQIFREAMPLLIDFVLNKSTNE